MWALLWNGLFSTVQLKSKTSKTWYPHYFPHDYCKNLQHVLHITKGYFSKYISMKITLNLVLIENPSKVDGSRPEQDLKSLACLRRLCMIGNLLNSPAHLSGLSASSLSQLCLSTFLPQPSRFLTSVSASVSSTLVSPVLLLYLTI
jgi:hypothetical protein